MVFTIKPKISPVKGKRIVLGISGGIAAYKTPLLVRLLKKAGAEVRVALTEAGGRFVSELSLATVSGEAVLKGVFPETDTPGADFTRHISLGEWADLFVIAPATANTIAKLSAGLSDDMLSATFITLRPDRPVLIFPAMDGHMFRSPSVQRNIRTLREQGCQVFEPESGALASGQCGPGRMAEPEEIFGRIKEAFAPDTSLAGTRVVVTAGPTRERIDGVRFISNYSSGRMGFALARAARKRGASVTLISGPVQLPTPEGVLRIDVESALEMDAAARERYRETDIFIAAAAVADYRPASPAGGKLKKGAAEMEVKLALNPDVLAGFGKEKRPGQLAVGFALETAGNLESARQKLERKNLDLIAFNTFEEEGAGFEVETNRITLLSRGGAEIPLGLMTKEDAAEKILDALRPAGGSKESKG
ncbi:bifunctional phosphopantothenoylcysteine decarboxylase/phosphopantothenate--cysteine ligase CoaBC [Chlorobium sp. N1]|uniref:bifunctional phosphopantothenoylcysteine decarboxylase/phosphopantothenate--cysteine ligase CoaBC n=1 Tax=Chlorobium sp. N1 TaxID=2491138 RepID=UPI00103C7285|nr:bifunctional phosphopantothenoylcysteine decarboxylase/phosphopantothenate--cysteine ligase CoaBC [Chlorobium sp. N1]TCD47988.1 bifunctional phosphopantothenoylcysteine decarboxylase/phosphopantothenate--cysteine ligase CoaBC [Chlorobium sp. N1]